MNELVKNQLLDAQDDLNRLRALLGLMNMATGDLISAHSKALSWGLEQAEVMAADLSERLTNLRIEEAA